MCPLRPPVHTIPAIPLPIGVRGGNRTGGKVSPAPVTPYVAPAVRVPIAELIVWHLVHRPPAREYRSQPPYNVRYICYGEREG